MNNLQVIEHKNERVLTTQQLAEIYETSTDNIKITLIEIKIDLSKAETIIC